MLGRPRLERGCLPPVAAQAGGGGKTCCSLRNSSRTLLARSWMQGGGRAIGDSNPDHPRRNSRRRATRSRWLDCPRRVCVATAGRTQGQCRRDTARSKDETRVSTAGNRGVGLVFGKTSQDGSTGKFLADTRALSSLRRARCGRTPPKSYATACGLESAHAPLLAKTHPMSCPSAGRAI